MNSTTDIKRCLLIDDEFHALELTANYISRLEGYEVVQKIRNPLLADSILKNENIDLVFLDINMPHLTGMELIKTIPENVVVVFTTAYSEHAAKAFDYSAADYLVKPFSFDRFLKAIDKAERLIASKRLEKSKKLRIRSDKSWIYINLNKIIYIEGRKEYVKIVTEERSYLTLMSLSKLEVDLPATEFTRIHKSYIVAIPSIIKYNKVQIELSNKTVLPVARNRSNQLQELLSQLIK
jgi:DNA-binding LytR/AlgR family response regulator